MQGAGPNNNWHYNRKLRPLAKASRRNMTKAEACLWKYALRASGGYEWWIEDIWFAKDVDFSIFDVSLNIYNPDISLHFVSTYFRTRHSKPKRSENQ